MDTDFKVLMTLMGMDIGGAETHVLELCKSLVKRGVTVYVASNGGAYEKELKENGIIHFKVPFHNKKIHNMVKAYFLIQRIIRENNIRLVHAHARIPAFICGLVQKKMDFHFVTTTHWIYKTEFPFNILSNWGEKSLAVSEDIKQYLIDNYRLRPENIKVTINGIDVDKFSSGIDYSPVAREFSFREGAFRIVYISRMDKDRSCAAHKLIEAAEDLYRENSRLEIVIVGGGDDFKTVSEKTASMNKKLGRRVIIMTDSRVDVNRFVASADIFVGVSRSALEAMAAKKPVVIAGNEGYIGLFNEDTIEVGIDTNFCCRGCRETSAGLIKEDLLTLMRMAQEERERLGKYGRGVIEKYYSLDRMADDAFALYEWVRYPKKEIDVMISGYYGFDNNGDDAVLKAIVDELKRVRPEINLLVLSKQPVKTQETYNVLSINRFDFIKIYYYLGRTQLLLSGGGSLIQDLTSTHSLIYYLSVIRLAISRGAKVILYANGIGPVRRESNKDYVRKILNRVDMITLRDEQSLQVLKSLGVTRPETHVTVDAAFSLENESDPADIIRWRQMIGLKEDEKYFCVSVRSWKYFKDNFESEMSSFVKRMKENYGLRAVFVPMQPVNDAEISRRIIEMSGSGIFFGTNYTTNQILSLIAGSEFVVAMRLHTIIYAVKQNVPVIGMAYDPKVTAFMNKAGQSCCIDVKDTNAEGLIKLAEYVMDNREEILKDMESHTVGFREKALENVMYAKRLLEQKEF